MSAENIPIFVSAGDPSGDIAGYHLLNALQRQNPGFQFFGLGGKRMKRAGQDQIVDGDELAVMGFWEVARKFWFFKRLMSDCVEQIKSRRPAAAILIDYPGFNLRLAARLHDLDVPVIYYISPQIWAWAPKRIEKIKRWVNLMLVILPFETSLYDKAGVPNRFVGHYLMDDLDKKYIRAPFNDKSDLVTLMPGSRPQEVERMLPTMLESAAIISKEIQCHFAIAGVQGGIDYNKYIKDSPISVALSMDNNRQLISESRMVIASSGTATLETGIIGRPMVVIYKTGRITYMIARRLVQIDKIALINIAAGKKIVPELIQDEATPQRIASEVNRVLADSGQLNAIVEQLNDVTDRLGGPGTSERAARAIREFINC